MSSADMRRLMENFNLSESESNLPRIKKVNELVKLGLSKKDATIAMNHLFGEVRPTNYDWKGIQKSYIDATNEYFDDYDEDYEDMRYLSGFISPDQMERFHQITQRYDTSMRELAGRLLHPIVTEEFWEEYMVPYGWVPYKNIR